jgi:membrane protease YdiL (CAAX protease family)
VLWHIFGQGPLLGATALFIGLLFALIRWRGGGILGLIVLHALWDLQSVLLVSGFNNDIYSVDRTDIIHPLWIILGYAMMLIVAVYLWKVHPMVSSMFGRNNV